MKIRLGLALCLSTMVTAIAVADATPPVAHETVAFASMMDCNQIRTYCYDMWWIRRHNYEQYVGCVYTNAENNGLSCQP